MHSNRQATYMLLCTSSNKGENGVPEIGSGRCVQYETREIRRRVRHQNENAHE